MYFPKSIITTGDQLALLPVELINNHVKFMKSA